MIEQVDSLDEHQIHPRKRTLWFDRQSNNTVLFVHGLSATPAELDPIPEYFAASLNASLLKLRLPGHGSDGAFLATATANDWQAAVINALDFLVARGQTIWLLASSTGATLLWPLITRYQASIAGVAMLSPNFAPRNKYWRLMNLPAARRWLPKLYGAQHGELKPADEVGERYWALPYPSTVLFEMNQAIMWARAANVSDLTRPIFVAVNEHDNVINPYAVLKQLQRAKQAPMQVTWFQPANSDNQHVLAGDFCNPSTTKWVQHQLQRFAQLWQ
ncbi:alpha/beta hydrolase [Salinibius halmophilus]|uniref:alpha/beta hydrolase n=1 Tax=Salinibius halmophilus TaxID=1853216 RepID=UPI000E65FAA9|nr:alpha/beta fold hydrolase [Salinibius halmophilus]